MIGWIVSFLKPSTFNLETSGTIFLEDVQVKNEKKCRRKKTIALLINFWNFCCAHIEKIDSLKLLFVCRLFGIKIFLVMKVSNDYVRIWVSTSATLYFICKNKNCYTLKYLNRCQDIWNSMKGIKIKFLSGENNRISLQNLILPIQQLTKFYQFS